MNYDYCGKYGLLESNFFKKLEALEVEMKKHIINIDSSSSSNSYYHGHAPSSLSSFFNATSTTYFNDQLIDSEASYHMAKDKAIFLLLMNVT
jgi:hypothetical protein